MFANRATALGVAAAFAAGAMALAQVPPPRPPAPNAGDGYPAWSGGDMQGRRAHEAARLKALHDVLAIRPEQEGAFQAFAAAMRPARLEGGERGRWGAGEGKRPGAEAQMTTPQRMDEMVRRFDDRFNRMRAALERRATATKAFYAALGPDQRRTMDALPELMGHGGMGKEGWGGGEKGRAMGHGPRGIGQGE